MVYLDLKVHKVLPQQCKAQPDLEVIKVHKVWSLRFKAHKEHKVFQDQLVPMVFKDL